MLNRLCGFGSSYEIAREHLGPILYDYSYRLHHYLEAMRDRDAVALYVARGGLRLHYLYRLYCSRKGLASPIPDLFFFTSRFATARACLLGDFPCVAPLVIREFENLPLTAMIEALMPGAQILDDGLSATKSSTSGLAALLNRDDKLGCNLRDSLREQASLMREYVTVLTEKRRRVVLIDTGWAGHTQAMLRRAFPDREWLGLYFGKWDYRREKPKHFSDVIGISVDGTGYNPLRPATALFCYHHLIEGILEAPIPSVSSYLRDTATGHVIADSQLADLPESFGPLPKDAMFQGITDYFVETPLQQSGPMISHNARSAYRSLCRMILFPRRSDCESLLVPARSADFGKPDHVPVILTEQTKGGFFERVRRIPRSLWMQGQVVRDWGRLAPLLLLVLYIRLVLRFVCERSNAHWKRLRREGEYATRSRHHEN